MMNRSNIMIQNNNYEISTDFISISTKKSENLQ